MKRVVLIALAAIFLQAKDIYIDEKRGLMWQDNPAAKHLKGYWDAATEYCNDLQLAGYDDWRLPRVGELYTLIDVSRYDPASIEQIRYVESDDYWSSSLSADDISDAWLVYFEDGVVNHYSKTRKRHIRCVRNLKKTENIK